MTGFVDWKYISEEQLQDLERTFTEEEISSKLVKIFDLDSLDEDRRKIAVRFHLYNYAFCKERAFCLRRTATFLSIMNEVFLRDNSLLSIEKSMESSFDFFEELLVKHSVERSPKSIKVFEREDVVAAVDFALERYFRNFKLYSYIFGVQARVFINQQHRGGVDVPMNVMPLTTALEMVTNVASE